MDQELLINTTLFEGMTLPEIQEALGCLSSYQKSFQKGEVIFASGSVVTVMGLIIEGSVIVECNDLWGNRTILTHFEKGNYFAEAYAMYPDCIVPVDIVANADCQILFLKIGHLTHCSNCNDHHVIHRLTANLLKISLQKNMALSNRSFHTASHNMRGKILAYLNTISLQCQSKTFDIPFDRQQLADYLNIDRTALSKELSKMKKDGLLDYWKNHFKLN